MRSAGAQFGMLLACAGPHAGWQNEGRRTDLRQRWVGVCESGVGSRIQNVTAS